MIRKILPSTAKPKLQGTNNDNCEQFSKISQGGKFLKSQGIMLNPERSKNLAAEP